jgi:hypothetical protein
MSQTVLPQLEIIEADLVSQESELSAQLEALREKLNGVRAVIPLFSGVSGSVSAPKAPSAAKSSTNPVKQPTSAKRGPKPTATKVSKTAQKKTSAKKLDGRAADWQKYTRPGVRNQSIPDAVKLILETQPNKEFKIAEVMQALFVDNIPKGQYLKARNRISNVLSGGVRVGDWHRGDRSTYRLSR